MVPRKVAQGWNNLSETHFFFPPQCHSPRNKALNKINKCLAKNQPLAIGWISANSFTIAAAVLENCISPQQYQLLAKMLCRAPWIQLNICRMPAVHNGTIPTRKRFSVAFRKSMQTSKPSNIVWPRCAGLTTSYPNSRPAASMEGKVTGVTSCKQKASCSEWLIVP